jgi:tetratricopeptide (TPR) repeat protein
VFESDHKLRHLPFFEAIASCDERSADWRAFTAGLVVLRMVDTWIDDGASVASDDDWAVRSVRSAIQDVDEGMPVRALLSRVVDSLQIQKPDIHQVVTPLMAYGQALEYQARWTLAADVYQSLLGHLHPVDDSDAAIAAHLRLGSCYRNLNLADDATDAFANASEIATAAGDMVGVLRARIGDANVAIMRGNLPKAEQIFDETIARAESPGLRDVRSRALHGRSEVAQLRGNYELSIQLAYQALHSSQSAAERDRILTDIAGAFTNLGVYSAARDAYLVLSVTASEQYVRWAANLNLMEIASLTGDEILFEQHRRQLKTEPLPPYLAVNFELNAGMGFHRFGSVDRATEHLRRAETLAAEHGLNRLHFIAQDLLASVEAAPPPPKVTADIPLDVQEVARAIRGLRETMSANR